MTTPKTLAIIALAALLVTPAAALARSGPARGQRPRATQQQQQQRKAAPRPQQQRPRIDLVIALDTSGSMGGLINAARRKLWDIIALAGEARPTPLLRVGLITYGSAGSEEDGYVRVRHDLTTDLDAISETLFSLTTNGGTEYVGRAIKVALDRLSWHRGPRTLRQIFIAGNESADQDRRVRSLVIARAARRRGIFVNTIFCGSGDSAIARGWERVSARGGGVYASIDHNRRPIAIRTPYDARLRALSARLNTTYVAYGRGAGAITARRARVDRLAEAASPSVAADRAVAKASPAAGPAKWDLVTRATTGAGLGGVSAEALPAPLRKKPRAEVEATLKKLARKRARIQKTIRELAVQRRVYIAREMKKRGKAEGRSLSGAIKRALKTQARAAGMTIE